MIVKNMSQLVENGSGKNRLARRAVLESIQEGIAAVQPLNLLQRKVTRRGQILHIQDKRIDLGEFKQIVVLGAGKATLGMFDALKDILAAKISGGLLIVPRGTENKADTDLIDVRPAGHPFPDPDGERAARDLLQLARSTGRDTLVICLISGGGSALMPAPAEGVSLEDKVTVTKLLMNAGASIEELNTVRKHISATKGGQLARACGATTVVSLVLSDVVGDPIHFIASGPTAPDPTTFDQAVAVLRIRGLWNKVPETVRTRLEKGRSGKLEETPKPGDEAFKGVLNIVIGRNADACMASQDALRRMGFSALVFGSHIEGEARHVGTALSSVAWDITRFSLPLKRKAALVFGGETTVTVVGKGTGGRNQEMALSAAMKIKGLKGAAFGSVGTDGIDGPTDAAGAIVDGDTILRASQAQLDAEGYLMENHAYGFFQSLKDLVFTGATGTNVGDLSVLALV